jgi:hypothetical protein
MKSFTLNINQNFIFNNTLFTEWNTAGTVLPWTMFDGSATRKSDFFVQGFKNIDVYGVSMVGTVYPLLAPAQKQALVQDWGVNVLLEGTVPLVNGFFGTNTFSATQGARNVFLSKYQNEFKLIDPIQSVQKISIGALTASGIQNESGLSVDLTFEIALIIYYKLEGE